MINCRAFVTSRYSEECMIQRNDLPQLNSLKWLNTINLSQPRRRRCFETSGVRRLIYSLFINCRIPSSILIFFTTTGIFFLLSNWKGWKILKIFDCVFANLKTLIRQKVIPKTNMLTNAILTNKHVCSNPIKKERSQAEVM